MLFQQFSFKGLSGGGGDVTAPTCTITSATSGTIYAGTFTCTFTFSEDVTGFELGDITVGKGAAGTFGTTSASVYTAIITPNAAGVVTVDVAAGVCTDGAGNENTAATQFTAVTAGWTFAAPIANTVAAYQAKGAASLAASYSNLVTPGTYDITAVNAPDWDGTNGWKFTAANSDYLIPGITPAADQTWSVFVRYTDYAGLNGQTIFGSYKGVAGGAFLLQYLTGGTLMRVYNGATTSIGDNAGLVTAGVYGFAGKTIYQDAVAETNPVSTGAGTSLNPIYIGCSNAGSPASYATVYIQAFAIYNTALSLAQVQALTTAMAAI